MLDKLNHANTNIHRRHGTQTISITHCQILIFRMEFNRLFLYNMGVLTGQRINVETKVS